MDQQPNSLKLWKPVHVSVTPSMYGLPGNCVVASDFPKVSEATSSSNLASHLFACEAVRPMRGKGQDFFGEPYTLPWFSNIENYRHRRSASWIPKVFEFAKHQGETILCLGNGLGTDWLQYARHGAKLVVCGDCESQDELVRRHFRLRKVEARFLRGKIDDLPISDACIDVICLQGRIDQHPQPGKAVQELHRVLKPGGKVIAMTPAKYDVDFWADLLLWYRWWMGKCRNPYPMSEKFSGRRLKKLFHQFEEYRIKKRQLRRAEVPHLWRLIPIPVLERVIGKMLVIKSFKPVSCALPFVAAA